MTLDTRVEVELGEKELRVLAWLNDGPSTVDSFVSSQGLYVNTWAPVFTYLKKHGLIKRSGVRLPTSHGSLAHELQLTPNGFYALKGAT